MASGQNLSDLIKDLIRKEVKEHSTYIITTHIKE